MSIYDPPGAPAEDVAGLRALERAADEESRLLALLDPILRDDGLRRGWRLRLVTVSPDPDWTQRAPPGPVIEEIELALCWPEGAGPAPALALVLADELERLSKEVRELVKKEAAMWRGGKS